jgi:flagellar hook-basal body complex protein FliE
LLWCCLCRSANQKRNQARRDRDRPLSETNNRTGEDGKDNQTRVHDAQTLITAPEERLPLGDGSELRPQGSFTSTDAPIAEVQETDENGASSGVPVKRLAASSGYREGSGVNDLMLLVKEAESNIRTVNQLRERAVDELHSARNEKENLQSQVEILKARLAESEAKLRHTVRAREKAQLLEEEVDLLKQTYSDRLQSICRAEGRK